MTGLRLGLLALCQIRQSESMVCLALQMPQQGVHAPLK